MNKETQNRKLVRLLDQPNLKEQAARWFSEKWSVPLEAYRQSMEDCLAANGDIPQWYLALEGQRIVGGVGVIENDFHDRLDLTPNVCAVFTEPDRRGQGIAGSLLDFACRDMQNRGMDTLYLVTDHTGFYERYGWDFFCMVQCSDGPSRMYVHRL